MVAPLVPTFPPVPTPPVPPGVDYLIAGVGILVVLFIIWRSSAQRPQRGHASVGASSERKAA